MSSTVVNGTCHQPLSNSLQSSLLVLQMLHSLTSKDTNLKNQTQALDLIEYLDSYVRQAEKEACDADQKYLKNVTEELQTNLKVVEAIINDNDGCILRQLVQKKDRDAVEVLLNKKADVNGICNSSSILHGAAATNDAQLIKLLVDKGADVNWKDKAYLTAVQRAALEGHDKAVHVLAKISAPPPYGRSKQQLSHLAAQGGHVSVLQVLNQLFPKTMLEEKNRKGETPLLVAAAHGHLDAVRFLISVGANPDAEDENNNNVLHKITEEKQYHLVDYLLGLQNITIDKQNADGNTPLHLALKNGQIRFIEILRNKHKDIWLQTLWWKGEGGNTVLHFTAGSNMHKLLDQILNVPMHQQYINKPNNFYNTPLHMAAEKNSKDAAKVLLRYGAKVNAVNKNLETPLHITALHDAFDTARELKQAGADLSAKEKSGKTPLELALYYKNFQTAYFLK